MSPQTIIFYGPSGSGKGTQAVLLKEYLENLNSNLNVLYLETGSGLRKFVEENDTYISNLTEEIINDGKLLPSFIPIWVWTNSLIKNYTGKEHLIWDGTRRLLEVSVLDTALKFFNRKDVHAVVLNVSKDWSIDKLKKRGRADDIDEEDILNRLSWYESDVIPAINFFRNNKEYKVHDINGEQTIKDVHNSILKELNV